MTVDQRPPATSAWQRTPTTEWYQRSRASIPFADAQFEVVRRVLAAHSAAPARILDLGAGDGIATAAMAESFDVRQATLVDFSPPMLDDARARAREWGIDVAILACDFADPHWVDRVRARSPFDLVISRYAIHHVPDDRKRVLYGEIFQMLEPGGWFVNIEHVAWVNQRYSAAFEDWVVEMIADSDPTRSRQEVAAEFRNRDDAGENILAPTDMQLAWLRDIGFVDVDCPFKVLELAILAGRRPADGPGRLDA